MGKREHKERSGIIVRYAPLWIHLLVYIFTCLIGAVLFYINYHPIVIFTEYFSGAVFPSHYSSWQIIVLWALLLGSPALLILGYAVGIRIRLGMAVQFWMRIVGNDDRREIIWIPAILFIISMNVGIHDLINANALSWLLTWNDYGKWIAARWTLFSTLGFFSFVNLYMILPVSAAWLILSIRGRTWNVMIMQLIPLAILIALTFFLFQKKALIASLIFVLSAVLLNRILVGMWTRRLTWLLNIGVGLLAIVYFMLVIVPVYSGGGGTASEGLVQRNGSMEASYKPCEKPGVPEKVKKSCKELSAYIGTDRNAHVAAYALLAPITRTSLPAMYYPIIFPEQHDYYGLDFGQDILGFGRMPDDNLVIWKYMYPDLPGGSAAAPYQFALYSQVGLIWTLLLCVVIGWVLGVMWQVVLTDGISRIWRSLMGALLVLYSIYLAIDSARGSLLASYGIIWPLLLVNFTFFIARIMQRNLVLGHFLH